jgi:hypothetical protein
VVALFSPLLRGLNHTDMDLSRLVVRAVNTI